MDFCKETDCLICYDKINVGTHTMCVGCEIFMHNECEKKYRGNKGYGKCPYCLIVGLIGGITFIDANDK